MSKRARRVLLFGAVAGLFLGVRPAAADRWEQHKGDCEGVFRSWRTQSVDRLRDCVMKWEMYRDVTKVGSDQRALVHEAFNKLYTEGDKRDARMALSALKRVGLQPARLRDEAKPIERTEARREAAAEAVVAAPAAPVITPDPVPSTPAADRPPDRRAAVNAYQRGKIFYEQGQIPEALSEFLISADSDPTYAPPLYMAARCYVKLDKPEIAVQYLQQMKQMNSDLARQLTHEAAKDPTFAPLRGMGTFKDLTGTAVIQLLNGAGDSGAQVLADYQARLQRAGLPVASVQRDLNPRVNTYLYTKPGYERQGESIRRLLQLGLIHQRTIDWPSEYDIILVYGEPKKTEWVDDEAEKTAAQAAADKKKAEAEAKKKKEAAAAAEKAELRKKIMMMKMLEQMNAEDEATKAAAEQDPSGGAIPPP